MKRKATDDKWIRLAAEFLRDYANRLGNDGCNDYTWPDWIDHETKIDILASQIDADDIECQMEVTYNWMVADGLAKLLEK
jgi:hypothetical protein